MSIQARPLDYGLGLLAPLLSLMVGCAPRDPPFQPKALTPPPVRYCFDTIGHIAGSKPWILGGTCFCTPTEAVLKRYKADGFCSDMSLAELITLYEQRGIKTGLDHRGCNNMCESGPHVLKGGHCMVPPTPGTQNYEEVFSGTCYVAASQKQKRKE